MTMPSGLEASFPEVDGRWELLLYVAGQSRKSMSALVNLQRLCEGHLKGRYRIEVVDVLKEPARADEHDVIAIPTVVRKRPAPARKVVGDLSDEPRALKGLEFMAG